MTSRSGLSPGPDGRPRCSWCAGDDEYVRYHDSEWGFPVTDDRKLFEKICLEGFQAGLSWLTILRKREAFRRGFAGFQPEKVARFGSRDVARLLDDAGIVRHRGKIESAIKNARRAQELAAEFGSIAAYVWRFEPPPGARPRRITPGVLRGMPKTAESIALSKDLKSRGFTFFGPTTAYAFMQAMGLVNDHMDGCAIRERAERARAFSRPASPAAPAPRPTRSGPRSRSSPG